MDIIELPEPLNAALNTLKKGGEAYVVGGWLRDALLGRAGTDYDLAVGFSAQRVAELFPGCRCEPNDYGGCTLEFEGSRFEITRFRSEDGYSDGRHPDGISAAASIEDDLSRRDFTCNALAYNAERGLVDPFGGTADITSRTLRCVGNAEARLREDTLRALRAVRFCSELGFSPDEQLRLAAKSIARDNAALPSAERCWAELSKTLAGQNAAGALSDLKATAVQLLPELKQASAGGPFSPYARALTQLAASPCSLELRLALLLRCCCADGVSPAEAALERLKAPRAVAETVLFLIENRACAPECTDACARDWLLRFGGRSALLALFCLLLRGKSDEFPAFRARLGALSGSGCFSLSELAVNGDDLTALGFSGARTGLALKALLRAAASGELPNEKNALLERAQKMLK